LKVALHARRQRDVLIVSVAEEYTHNVLGFGSNPIFNVRWGELSRTANRAVCVSTPHPFPIKSGSA
jgi:hypothetical protein